MREQIDHKLYKFLIDSFQDPSQWTCESSIIGENLTHASGVVAYLGRSFLAVGSVFMPQVVYVAASIMCQKLRDAESKLEMDAIFQRMTSE